MLKKTQSVYIPSLHPMLWDYGVPSHIYYSVGKTARTVRVQPNAIRERVKRKTVSFVRVNGRIFIPTYAIRLEKAWSNRPGVTLPIDDLALLLILENRGATAGIMTDGRVKEFWDLASSLVVTIPHRGDIRNILAFRRIDDRLLCAQTEMSEGLSRQLIQDLCTSEPKALLTHFSPESWHYFKGPVEIL